MKKKLLDLLAKKRGIVDRMRQAAPILRRQSRSTAASACMPLRSASAPRHAASVQPLRPTQTFCAVPWQPKTPVP